MALNQCHLYSSSGGPNTSVKNKSKNQSYTLIGSCSGDSTSSSSCPSYPTKPPTNSPTYQPTPEPAASIILPTPPLPLNKFADGIQQGGSGSSTMTLLSPSLAYECVYLAGRFIYKVTSADHARDILPEGYDFVSYYDKGSTEVMVVTTNHTLSNNGSSVKKKGKIIVIFRGTDDTLDGDWLTNINLPKVNFGPKGKILSAKMTAPGYFGIAQTYELKVHRGFNGVFSDGLYDTLLKDITPLLQRESGQDSGGGLYYENTIHFFGHSLGGANAQLFGTYFAFFHPEVKTHVTTLGAPRQGNYAYKILVESLQNLSVWRMVNCRDVVPRVPFFQYYHAGHLIWKRCDPPSSSSSSSTVDDSGSASSSSANSTSSIGFDSSSNDVVEAYYRQSGDLENNLVSTPSEFIVRQYEDTMISDHLGFAYLEWLEYANGFGRSKNWTTYFQSDVNVSSS
eukprot:CAMPEP_0203693780 /NCGR_PEP_ID=MMETSP0091-20130426/5653_1 /ASSEMBLY_ACC=CAM_ASM_001089 /TAXON_ID=426623 /ORGANISM="Chaetoceros affinis, Strain CCMP159" /LENGTH=451 /DNA_ID=CAMNT_0050564941 /DNA_START=351 /DNA_END=1706 /DNA_ORIENTATION=+